VLPGCGVARDVRRLAFIAVKLADCKIIFVGYFVVTALFATTVRLANWLTAR
jgi:hypothetical protein